MRNKVMRILLAALALAGLVVSVLALRVHNMDPNAAPPCAVSEHWDCGAVNHSRFAVFPPRSYDEDPKSPSLHIPISIFGIGGYGLMLILALTGSLWILLQFVEIGFAFASFLTYLEAYILEKWCIYCVWSQVIITTMLITTIIALLMRRRDRHVFEMQTNHKQS